MQLCSRFGVLRERFSAFIVTLHRSAEDPAAIRSWEESSAATGGAEEGPVATGGGKEDPLSI